MGKRHSLKGKTAFITGAARGIGAETARQLSAKGMNIAICDLRTEELASVAKQLGPNAIWSETDVCKLESLQSAVDEAKERFGSIDVVVANAGIVSIGAVQNLEHGLFEKTIDVNLLGVWRTIFAALPHLVESRGYMLSVASAAAAVSIPLSAHYSASKAGVEALSNSLRMEVAGQGVEVGVAYFGVVRTDMFTEVADTPEGQDFVHQSRLITIKPKTAASALVKGIEKRSKRVISPRIIRPALSARWISNKIMGRHFQRLSSKLDN